MHADDKKVADHYRRPGLLDAILAGLRAVGIDPDAPTARDLEPVDHFHLGGADETHALIDHSDFTDRMWVLDAGGGIGGPARALASRVGCRVTVLDLADDFCALGEELTRRTGLGERVWFRCGSALRVPFDDAHFDGAWTQHSTMNIADKRALYRELHRVIRPGARLVQHEVVAGSGGPVHFPVPWARHPETSFLVPADELREAAREAGFVELAFGDTTDRARAWLRRKVEKARQASASPPLGVHLLLGEEAPVMFANMLRNIEEGRQRVVQMVFERGR